MAHLPPNQQQRSRDSMQCRLCQFRVPIWQWAPREPGVIWWYERLEPHLRTAHDVMLGNTPIGEAFGDDGELP